MDSFELPVGGRRKYRYELTDGYCTCYPNPRGGQTVHSGFWEVIEPKPFHDDTLMEATGKINRLLDSAAEKSPDPERELCFIRFQGRPFLVWSKTLKDALTADDDPEVVAEALGLRLERPSV